MKNKTNKIGLLQLSKRNLIIYGKDTIEDRAIPDYRDGLKPVHRRLLWAAYKGGFTNNSNFKKSARLVGDTIGKYHPHGDVSCYDSLVNMANAIEPMFDKQGNFGGLQDSYASQRYTETRLSKYSEENLLDPIYMSIIPYIPNYDGLDKEPLYLPSKLPNLLLQGTEGIATGCSNLIPSFSIKSIKKIIKTTILKGKCTPKMCLKLEFKFPYGGYCIEDKKSLLEYYKTGFKTLYFAPHIEIKKDLLIIKDMNPRMDPTKVEDKLLDLDGIKDIEVVNSLENSDWIHIYTKKGVDLNKLKEIILDKLKTFLACQTYITERISEDEIKFKATTIPNIIEDWVVWRISLEKLVIQHLIKIENDIIQKLTWLEWAYKNLDTIVKALKSKDPEKVLKKGLSEEGAKYILSQQVRKLSKLEIDKIRHDKIKHTRIKKQLKVVKPIDRILKTLD